MNNPVISVIMPCYNAAQFIADGIASVQGQSFQDWELIIVDDGSTDNSLAAAQCKAADDERIRIFSQKNSGACVARNLGIREAQGQYIKFLDADDLLEKDCLKHQIEHIQSLSPSQIPFGDYNYIDAEGAILSNFTFQHTQELKNDPEYFFFSHWEVLISSPLHRTELVKQIGGFDEHLKRGQESDFHFRLAMSGVQFVYCPCSTFSYRRHSAEAGITNRSKSGAIDMVAYWEYRNNKCEILLREKYGNIPDNFKPVLYKFWFDKARYAFEHREKGKGLGLLKRANQIGKGTAFQHFYQTIGCFIGYTFLEHLLQIRLKLVGKKKLIC